MSFQKKSLLLSSTVLLSTTYLQAAEPISPPPRKGPYQIHDGVRKEVTPPAGPRLSDWSAWKLNLDVIAWQPRMENLAFACSGVLPAGVTLGAGATLPSGHQEDLNYRYRPGFKFGFGLDFRHDGWDTNFNYTWFQEVSAQGSADLNSETPNLVAMWANPTINEFPENNNLWSANGDFRIRYNILDWELGRNSFLSKYVTIRPFFGLKAAFIYSKYTINYFFESPSILVQQRLINNMDFRGLGLRGGLNACYLFATSWSFYGDLAFTGMWGQYIKGRKDKNYLPGITEEIQNVVNTQDYQHAVKPVIELGGGIQWQTWFYRDKWRLTVRAGWEEQLWINFNQMIRFEGVTGGDMSLEGLTVSARMDF